MNDKADYRTAPATPVLLKTEPQTWGRNGLKKNRVQEFQKHPNLDASFLIVKYKHKD